MKKIFFLTILSLFITSCQGEQEIKTETVQTVETLKTDGMRSFDTALKIISKGQGRYADENKQLNQMGIDILLPASKKLLSERKTSQTDIQSQEEKQVIKAAFTAYQENLSKYRDIINSKK